MTKSLWYDAGKLALWSGKIDLEKHKIRCALMTSEYNPSTKHALYSDLHGETAGNGYKPGGPVLTGQKLEMRSGLCRFLAADVVIPACTCEAAGVAIYHEASGTLIAYIAARKPDRARDDDFVLEWKGEPILSF